MSALCPQTASDSPDRESRRWQRPQRTREGQAAKRFRAELLAHLCGAPSPQRALIEQAVQIKLRLAVMDHAFAGTSAMTLHNSRTYLAWSNSLVRTLRTLGLKSHAERPPSLADYLARRSAAAGSQPGAAPSTPADGGRKGEAASGPESGVSVGVAG